ncbi:hypothetical protein, partial [Escherichia coli]|uniref:hypothetical protein n=1 Tax=Escherichia coli TaxID=562 RepID=UPI001FBB448B|nr:hypothetical protein [Escherichia coli]
FSDPGPVFHTIVSIKNDGHYFCRAGGNRPDGLNEPVTFIQRSEQIKIEYFCSVCPVKGKRTA